MRYAKCLIVLAGLLIASAALTPLLLAQPVRDRVLAGVEVAEVAECAVVAVSFNFPVRYVSHFPFEAGDELRIQLRAIALSPADEDVLFKRESLRAPKNRRAAIAKIVYEGDRAGGPILTIFFRHPVAFQVGQGADFRSLVIAIPGPEPSESCLPVSPNLQ